MQELTLQQKETLGKYIERLKEFLKTSEGQSWIDERKSRTVFFQDILSIDKIDNLREEDFGKIIKSLYASEVWTNKNYLVNKIIQENGIQKIRTELKKLLYGNETIDKRFDEFKKNIKGLGPSSITEILVFVFPEKYCLWNEKPKNVLPFLGLKKLLPDKVYKYPINGSDYLKCIEVLGLIKDEMIKHNFHEVDFHYVDILMWFIFSKVMEEETTLTPLATPLPVEKMEIDPNKLTHWDVVGILVELGNMLGFDTYVADPSQQFQGKKLGDLATLKEIPPFTYEKIVDTAKNIDVIWFKDEFPRYCFEVEHTTGVSLGLLRLFQVKEHGKLFIVAPREIYPKFQKELAKDPFYKVKEKYNFRSYDELVRVYLSAKEYHRLEKEFLGQS